MPVAAVEAVGPFPQIAWQVLGADTVVGAGEPGFDVAEPYDQLKSGLMPAGANRVRRPLPTAAQPALAG